MSGLFNNIFNLGKSAQSVEDGALAAALESIGAAVGELRSGISDLPKNMERAIIGAISSDSTNEALYDAVASASYDAMVDAHDDTREDSHPADDALPKNIPGRDFSLADLFTLPETARDDDDLKSLQIDFLSNTAPGFYEKGNRAFDRILESDKPVDIIDDDPGTADIKSAGEVEDDKWVQDILNELNDTSDQSKGQPTNATPDTIGLSPEINQGLLDILGEARENTDTSALADFQAVGGDNEKIPDFPDDGDAKRMRDLQLDFFSSASPDFYGKGSKAFDRILDGKLDPSDDGETDMGMLGQLGLATGITALTAAVNKLLNDGIKFFGDQEKSRENVSEMHQSGEEHLAAKYGADDPRVSALKESNKASGRVHELESSLLSGWFADEERTTAATQLYEDILSGKVKMENADPTANPDREAARKYVLENLDKQWEASGSEIGLRYTKELVSAKLDLSDADAAYREALGINSGNTARPNETQNGEPGNDRGYEREDNPQNISPGDPRSPSVQDGNLPWSYNMDVPLGPGSMEMRAPSVIESGDGMMMQDVLTTEEQMQQFKRLTFEGIRDALMLPEVRSLLITTAQTAGSAMEKKLMG
jgi:hypothetical protein